jgi:hypothetical protein
MVTCWRCGVDFDATAFLPAAPCPDCQLDEPMYEWVRFEDVKASEDARKRRHIERLYKRRYSDSEIAEAVGMSASHVNKIRRELGLPAHRFTGDEKWRDPEAVRAAISARKKGNHDKRGWRKNT